MIVSASRRTDVPAFYLNWFLNRLRAGWLLVRNPYNPHQVSRVTLSPRTVECIVFWTKNPEPMLRRLADLEPYPYYVQYTVNPYGPEMESGLPELSRRLDTFLALADALGKERVVWRYSPVILGDRYSASFHLEAFERIADTLTGHTAQCKLSFIELYAKIRARMAALGMEEAADPEVYALARGFAALAEARGMELSACGKPDLRPAGIAVSRCVDGGLIRKITGKAMTFKKDPGQRGVCNCDESVDIGSYHTCPNGCVYCYANHSHNAASARAARHDPESPFLCDAPRPGDVVTERKVRMHEVPEQARLPMG